MCLSKGKNTKQPRGLSCQVGVLYKPTPSIGQSATHSPSASAAQHSWMHNPKNMFLLH